MRRIVVLLLLIPTLSPAQERAAPPVDLASLLPADTLFLFEYDDLGGKEAWLRNTTLGRILAEPDMQAFLKPMGESIKKALEKIAQQFNPLAAIGLKAEDFKGIAIRRFGLALVNASFAAATPDIDAVLRIEFRKGGANAMKIAGKLKLAAEQHMEVAFEKQELLGKTVWRASARGHEIFAHVDETQILLTSKLPRMKQVLSGTLKTSLAKSERFTTLIKRMGATRRGTLLFANVPSLYDRMLNLVRTHEGPDDAAETEEICKAIGLDAVQACAMADIPAGTGFRTEFAVTMSARRGMFTTIGTERVKHLFTQHVPESAMIYGAEANDLEAYFRNLQRMMMRFEPQGSKEIEDGWKELDALLGVDLRKDLLAALGTQWATYISAPPAGGLIPDFCVFVNIRDRATLEASLDKMVKRIAGLAKEGGLTVVPRETFYRTGRIRFLELSHKGKPVPVAPAWAFGDGYLIVAPFPQSIKGAWADKPSIEKKEDFRALLRQIPDSSVSCTYVDTKRLFGWLYNTGVPLLQGFQGAANVRLEPTGIRLNFEDLPPAEVIQKHLRGLMFYTAVEDDCVRMGYVSDFGAPLVLVPLAAGFALGLAMISAVDRLVKAAPPVPPPAPAKKAKKKEAVWHKEADQRLTALEAEIARTKAQLDQARVDALRVRTAKLGAAVNKMQGELATGSPVDGPARGAALNVQADIVTINLGARHGVRVGQQLHLKRGGKYIGPIIVISTEQGRARARFEPKWAVKAPAASAGRAARQQGHRSRPCPRRREGQER
ncbi:MAG: hypothetical protein O7E54_12455, partial [Planctomycetota bacterium]|nr:hypothetical protein [Planctomycetota bacterium]